MPQTTALIESEPLDGPPRANRRRLPEVRPSVTHHFRIANHEGYLIVGLYPNGSPGEIFIKMAKEGSTISGLMDTIGTTVSVGLQHGVPLKVLCEKLAHMRFEPSGWTGNEQIGYAKSLMDYIFRWLELRFLKGEQLTMFARPLRSIPRHRKKMPPPSTAFPICSIVAMLRRVRAAGRSCIEPVHATSVNVAPPPNPSDAHKRTDGRPSRLHSIAPNRAPPAFLPDIRSALRFKWQLHFW